jgi:hypothetical protein
MPKIVSSDALWDALNDLFANINEVYAAVDEGLINLDDVIESIGPEGESRMVRNFLNALEDLDIIALHR